MTVNIALIGIAAGLFGILAAHRLQLWRTHKDRLREVAATYRAAFAGEVLAFQLDAATMNTLVDGFDRHQAAVTTALPLLGKRDSARVQRAWDDYRGANDPQKEIGVAIVIAGYSHPDFMQQGRRRFLALASALDHLAT